MEIEKAVESADAVIVCLSNNSVSKEGYVQKELRRILDKAEEIPENVLFIIPLRLDDCQPPRRLVMWHYVDYYPKGKKDWAYRRILESMKLRQQSLNVDKQKSNLKTVGVDSYLLHQKNNARVFANFLFTESDEWFDPITSAVGLTDYGQRSLSTILSIQIPVRLGDHVEAGNTVATIESVDYWRELWSPVSGIVIKRNEILYAKPEVLNIDPYGEGWVIEIDTEGGSPRDLISTSEYETYCKSRR